MPITATTTDSVPIDQALAHLGFAEPAAMQRARRKLEAHGLTNPRKRALHRSKPRRVGRLLATAFVRTCGCEPTPPGEGWREAVKVSPKYCQLCRGKRTVRAVRLLLPSLRRRGLRRILVVGGAPGAHRFLRQQFLHTDLSLTIVEGDRAPRAGRARALAASADLIVIWAGTILDHSVAELFRAPDLAGKTVVVPRRGIEVFCTAVDRHVNKDQPRAFI